MDSNASITPFKSPQNFKQWIDLFFDACKSGDLSVVKKLCSSEFQSIADIHAENELGFQLACREGHLDVVQFLTTSKDLLEAGHTFVDIHVNDGEEGFRSACNHGHLEIVKFLTTSKELLESGHSFVDIHAKDEQGFRWACERGHLEILKFLTTSKELIKAGHSFVDLHAENEWGFRVACSEGHLEIVKFLTTSQELLEAGHTFVDIHAENEQGFKLACEKSQASIIQFLIFDLKIERNPTINTIIKKYPQAQEFFRVREEQEQIQQSLIESHSTLETPTSPAQEIKSNSSLRI